jgi:hypothetical protein
MAEQSRYGTARAEWSASAAVNAGMSSRRYLYSDDDVALKNATSARPLIGPAAVVVPRFRRRAARLLALFAYRAMRPAVRSIAWRTRTFMAHDLHEFSARADYAARHSEHLAREQHAQVVTLLGQVEAHSLLTAAEQKRSMRMLANTLDQQAKKISLLSGEIARLQQAVSKRDETDD